MDMVNHLMDKPQTALMLALGRVDFPLYVVVEQAHVQVHLQGAIAIERKGQADLLYLRGNGTHVHINWGAVNRVERRMRGGCDCIGLWADDERVLELMVGRENMRFSSEIDDLIRACT